MNESKITPQTAQCTDKNNEGEVPTSAAVVESADGMEAANLPREESQADATRRWRRTGIAEQVAVYRDRKREEYSRANPKAKRRDAHEYAWACAMAEFPPPGIEPQIAEPIEVSPIGEKVEIEEPAIEDPAQKL